MAGKSVSNKSIARSPRRTLPSALPESDASNNAKARLPESGAAKRLLRAGIKALGEVQGDVLARQNRIFEVLLGIGQSPGWPGPSQPRPDDAGPDPFGKFEHVFDERVARSLARLGMPTPEALKDLSDRIERLTEALDRLEATRRKR